MEEQIVEFTVNGRVYREDLKQALRVEGTMEEKRDSAAMASFWGIVWANATYEFDLADFAYRNWYGGQMNIVGSQHEGTDSKGNPKPITEWRATFKVEGSPEFRGMKQRVAEARLAVNCAKVLFETWKMKHDRLDKMMGVDNSNYGMARSFGQSGDLEQEYSTPLNPRAELDSRKEDQDARLERVRDLFRGKPIK